MIVTREQVVAEARSWLDTPYRHQGRLKGVSVDCVGLVLCVSQALGLGGVDHPGYTRRPDGSLRDAVYGQTLPVAPGEQAPGDIVVFHWQNSPFHLAILSGVDSIIHAFAVNRKVCEHGLDDKWRASIATFRKMRGVE